MAKRIVQPKVKTADGSYDDLIMQQAVNATKINNLEIKLDENGVLKYGDIVIPQRKLIWRGLSQSTLKDSATLNFDKTLSPASDLEIWGSVENQSFIIKTSRNQSDFNIVIVEPSIEYTNIVRQKNISFQMTSDLQTLTHKCTCGTLIGIDSSQISSVSKLIYCDLNIYYVYEIIE